MANNHKTFTVNEADYNRLKEIKANEAEMDKYMAEQRATEKLMKAYEGPFNRMAMAFGKIQDDYVSDAYDLDTPADAVREAKRMRKLAERMAKASAVLATEADAVEAIANKQKAEAKR